MKILWGSSNIFQGSLKILFGSSKVFKDPQKMFEDPQRTFKDPWRSSKILARFLRILARFLRILARFLRICKDLGNVFWGSSLRSLRGSLKIFMRIFEDPQRSLQDFHQGWSRDLLVQVAYSMTCTVFFNLAQFKITFQALCLLEELFLFGSDNNCWFLVLKRNVCVWFLKEPLLQTYQQLKTKHVEGSHITVGWRCHL